MRSGTGTILLIASLAAAPARIAEAYPFDDSGYVGDASLMPDWSATLARQSAQSTQLTACLAEREHCPSLYRGVAHMLGKAAELAPERQAKLVNYYVNRKQYREDPTTSLATENSAEPLVYRSRWATVEEFLRQGGDCEDFATTKYFLLRQLGFEADQLRVVVAYDYEATRYHAILAVRLEHGKVLLLESDNRIRSGGGHGYRFIYSVNEKSIWDHEASPGPSRIANNHEENPP